MRRDAKLGLALGMLVVGFATAFCFPRQSESIPWLKHAEPTPIADSELNFLPIRAYQSAPVDAAPSLLSQVENRQPNISSEVPLPIGVSPAVSTQTDVVPSLDHPLPSTTRSPADATMTNRPSGGSSLESLEQTYVIRPGDTLTGISMRFFGTTQRFQQIYDRNRDRLKSENDLRVGTEIVIPGKATMEPVERISENTPRFVEADVTPAPQPPRDPVGTPAASRFERTAGAPFLNDRPPPR